MKIFAHHAHVFPDDVRSKDPEIPPPASSLPELCRLMEQCGIDRAVVFAPFPEFYEGTGFHPNRWLSDEIKNYPFLEGFGTIDFKKENIEEQVEEIKKLGLKGIKLHPAVQKFSILSSKAFRVYKVAQNLNLPISFHTGVHWYPIKETHPLLLDEVAHRFPRLRFSMEHVGGYHFFKDAVAVIMNNFQGGDKRLNSNIYAGIVSVFEQTIEANFWYLGEERVKELINLIGDSFLIFGLDFPYRTGEEIKRDIRIIKYLDISNKSKEKILGKNLEKFLGP